MLRGGRHTPKGSRADQTEFASVSREGLERWDSSVAIWWPPWLCSFVKRQRSVKAEGRTQL